MTICRPVASLLLVAGVLALSGRAEAQLNRTAVSSKGDDLNNCAPVTPCRTFNRAISQTNAGGEVIAVDSAGYGPFVVDRAVTVQAAPGVYAGITATSGYAIQISAGASDTVVLRGLSLAGLDTGSIGVAVIGGAALVHVESCVIQGFADWGILSYFNIRISDTTVRHSRIGIQIDNAGGPVNASLERVQLKRNVEQGLLCWRNATCTVKDSLATQNAEGFHARVGRLTVEDSLATENSGAGLLAGVVSEPGTLRISNVMVTQNGNGLAILGTGIIETWGNNHIAGNTVNVMGSLTPVTFR